MSPGCVCGSGHITVTLAKKQVDLYGKTLDRLIWINFVDATLVVGGEQFLPLSTELEK